jgi:hypothetical protein
VAASIQNQALSAILFLYREVLNAPLGWIDNIERGVLEPPLHVLLAYARSFGISTDVLIDDESDLPARFPSMPKHPR